MKDKITAKIASQVMKKLTRDERIVRILLGTRKENVPNLLLIVSTPFVQSKATSKLSKLKVKGRVSIGYFENTEIGVVDVGMGTPSAAMIMEAVVRTKPIAVVRSEVCGGLSSDQSIGDIIIADSAIVGDGSGIIYYGNEVKVQSNDVLMKVATRILENNYTKYHIGPIWTTDVLFRQTKDLLESWRRKGALAVDMESSAILGISQLEGIPAISLNCVSDLPLHGSGPFDMESVDPNFLSGVEIVIETGLRTLIEWRPRD